MADLKTPGVYIVEKDAFPNSVVAVATAIPVFIGYTGMASRGQTLLTNVPTRISSMVDFEQYFGGPPPTRYSAKWGSGGIAASADPANRFLLYHGMKLFFANGGGPCYVVSVGGYTEPDGKPRLKSAGDFHEAFSRLEQEAEPTIVVVPDAVFLPQDDFRAVSMAALKHCQRLRSRVAILDVFDGCKARTGRNDDVISGSQGFRQSINGDDLSFGAAYYPWLNTSVATSADIDYTHLDAGTRERLAQDIRAEVIARQKQSTFRKSKSLSRGLPDALSDLLDLLATTADAPPAETTQCHESLLAMSPLYRDVMATVRESVNVMPPSPAIAGLYALTDASRGVFKAPANASLNSVISPTVALSTADQADLNAPADGKAVNAIRAFPGKGVLVWGARTLAANNLEWRYISIRRTAIMLEQSIAMAMKASVFEPNDANTWQTLRSMIENFLNAQWRMGALAGSTPDQAFHVSVGLGETMTRNDIDLGRLRVSVAVALARPAEFIVLTIEQRMQTS